MPSAVFRPPTPAIERPQTYVLDRTVTGIDFYYGSYIKRKYTVKNVDFLNVVVDGAFTYLVITTL